jgi:CRP/FNR family transcriptional regulator
MLKKREKLSISCLTCKVGNLCLLKHLSDEEKSQINNLLTNAYLLEKGEHLYRSKTKLINLYAIYSGCCKEYYIDKQGEERIVNFYFPGDILAFESIPYKKHTFSSIALTKTMVCLVPLEPLFNLMSTTRNLLERFIHITSYKMQNDQHIRMTTNAKQRLADFLQNIILRIQERNCFSGYIQLPMTHYDISNFLGMSHETVSRILHSYQDDKIIEIKNKTIYITNFESLKKIAKINEVYGQI